ncbi:MAG: hypothetical protein Q9226_001936 [Calogaya cf. arnoldii]
MQNLHGDKKTTAQGIQKTTTIDIEDKSAPGSQGGLSAEAQFGERARYFVMHPESFVFQPLSCGWPIQTSSSGLGRAIALAFAANGACPIICTDLRPDPRGDWGVEEASVPTHKLICRKYGERKAEYIKADATVSENVERVVKRAVEIGGRLDV